MTGTRVQRASAINYLAERAIPKREHAQRSAAPRDLMAGGSIVGENGDGSGAASITVLVERLATRSPLATNLSKIA